MPVPQRITVVTLGARSVTALRACYGSLGWEEKDGCDETFTSFTMGSLRLALYPIDLLGREAAPRDGRDHTRPWNGVTLAINMATREAVDEAFAAAIAAGAQAVEASVERSWGGYSGYVADPEGHRWELAWAPWPTTDE